MATPTSIIDSCEGSPPHRKETTVEGQRQWFPEVDVSMKPHQGKIFDTLEEAEFFYKKYASQAGFNVRKSSTEYDKNKELKRKLFVCYKEGFRISTSKDKAIGESKQKKKKLIVREGCKAQLAVSRNSDGKWFISKFIEAHCHLLTTPSRKHLMKTNQEVTKVHRSLLESFNETRIGVSQPVALWDAEYWGYENTGCTEQDIRNVLGAMRLETEDFDAQLLLQHFQGSQEMNTSQYYAYKVDDEQQLKYCFWADGLSRKAYKLFGEVVVFDTTYSTNKDSIIFASFTGVNHHGQSTTFGCGILQDKKADSFVWLFEKFLEAMDGCYPKAIVTDQHRAMEVAIQRVFPNTAHRYCIWHIMNKMSEKLGPTKFNKSFKIPFEENIWQSDTCKELEEQWMKLVKEHGLQDNEWLDSLYTIREKWIPVYFRDVLLIGMRLIQKSESLNEFYNKYVQKNNSLIDFIRQFDSSLKRQRNNELEEHHKNLTTTPLLKTRFDNERQMVDVYTHYAFDMFQIELTESLYLRAERTSDAYLVTPTVPMSQPRDSLPREVVYNEVEKKATCDCKLFEGFGIPCRHILFVLRSNGVSELPSHFIMKRWTKTVMMEKLCDANGIELQGECNLSQLALRRDFWKAVGNLTKEAFMSDEKCRKATELLRKASSLIRNARTTTQATVPMEKLIQKSSNRPDSIEIYPPTVSTTNGCSSHKRLKSGKEKAVERPKRLCRGCGKHANHDKRNCPVLLNLEDADAGSTSSSE